MNEYEIKLLQQRVDRLENTISKKTTTTFVWLMILSNLIFLLFFACVGLKHGMDTKIDLTLNALKSIGSSH